MVVEIPNVFSQEEVTEIIGKLTHAEFIDGKRTAGWNARSVKNNQQLKGSDPTAAALKDRVKTVLSKNRVFQSTVRPRFIHSLLFSRHVLRTAY